MKQTEVDKWACQLLWTCEQTAKALRISERKLWDVTAPRGALQCVRIGARVTYDPADVRQFIQRCKRGGVA